MKIPGLTMIRAAACAVPFLVTGCVVVPDGADVHHAGPRIPAYSASYSTGYYSTWGPATHVRPHAPTYYISRPPPAVVVRPPPVVVVPPPRPPAFGYRNFDRPPHVHGSHGSHGGHGGSIGRDGRRDGDRGGERSGDRSGGGRERGPGHGGR